MSAIYPEWTPGRCTSLAKAFRDVAFDLDGIQIDSPSVDQSNNVSSSNATTVSGGPAGVVYTATERDMINDLQSNFNAAVTLINELKTEVNALRATVTDLHQKLSNVASYTLTTTAPSQMP